MNGSDNVRIPIGACIRGCTSNGHTPLIVTFLSNDSKNAHLRLSAPTSDVDATILRWQDQFYQFVITHHGYPATVAVEGQSGLYGLGFSLDEAKSPEHIVIPKEASEQQRLRESLKGKVVVVTGGAQGFGEGIIRALVEEGCITFIADLNEDGARHLADELNGRMGQTVAIPVRVDVTNEDSVEHMMEFVAQTTGCCDVFISNAGVLKAGSVKELSLKDFQFVTSVDYTGFFICTKFASRLMAWQDKAAKGTYLTDIIAISSKSGLEGSNRNGAYAGAKFGTIGLVQSFALELVKDHIKVNAVCPGNFLEGPLWSDPVKGLFVQYLEAGKVPGAKTIEDVRRFYESKVPMGRGCTTTDVVRAICYIVEQKYETGQSLPVTGGQIMLH